MKYLVVIPTDFYMQHPKNHIETAVFNLFKEYSRKLIDAKQITGFKKKISAAIEQINTDHPDSKPLASHWTFVSANNYDQKITLAYGNQFIIRILVCEPDPIPVPEPGPEITPIEPKYLKIKKEEEAQ